MAYSNILTYVGKLPILRKHLLDQILLNTKNIFSDSKPQEIGEPQVSILSVINKTTTCLPLEINGSLYVNDYLICYSSKIWLP